jgi:hypothetical protein
MQAGRLRSGREPDRAIEALVVRDREAGKPQLRGAFDQVIRRGCPVEEREVAVTVKLGVRGRGHGIVSGGRESRLEQTFGIVHRDEPEIGRVGTQPNEAAVRHSHVTAHPAPSSSRRIATDLLLRFIAIAFVTLLILGILPAIADAVA